MWSQVWSNKILKMFLKLMYLIGSSQRFIQICWLFEAVEITIKAEKFCIRNSLKIFTENWFYLQNRKFETCGCKKRTYIHYYWIINFSSYFSFTTRPSDRFFIFFESFSFCSGPIWSWFSKFQNSILLEDNLNNVLF